jgi:hypothetical protein
VAGVVYPYQYSTTIDTSGLPAGTYTIQLGIDGETLSDYQACLAADPGDECDAGSVQFTVSAPSIPSTPPSFSNLAASANPIVTSGDVSGDLDGGWEPQNYSVHTGGTLLTCQSKESDSVSNLMWSIDGQTYGNSVTPTQTLAGSAQGLPLPQDPSQCGNNYWSNDYQYSFNVPIDTSSLSAGTHTLYLEATDGAGTATTSFQFTVGAVAPTANTSTITVLSENSSTGGPVEASWDIAAGSSYAYPGGTDICADGAVCNGSDQTYTDQPAVDASGNSGVTYTMDPSSIVAASPALYTLKSVQRVPIAQKKIGIIDELLSFTKNMLGSTAEAYTIPLGNPLAQTLTPTSTVSYIILWAPVANITVTSTNPLVLTSTLGSSTSGQAQIANDGAPGSQISSWYIKGITYTNGNGWLSVTPTSTASPLNQGDSENVTINVNSTGLSAGTTYIATIKFDGVSEYGLPQDSQATLTVSYDVTPANPGSGTVSGVTITSCNSSTITTAQVANCTASVTGTGSYDDAVTWTVDTGTISSTGSDTAQFDPAVAGTANITACAAQAGYTNVCDTSQVVVTAPPLGDCTPGVNCPTCSNPMISASPSNIVIPESSELSYNCQNVNSCSLTGSDGSNYPITWVNSTTASGTQPVDPTVTTVYTFACTNTNYSSSSATVSSPVQVTVGGTTRCEQNPNGAGCPGQ